MLNPCRVTMGLLILFSVGACAEEEPACGAPLALGSYAMQLDELSRSCLGPFESLLPSEFIIDSALTTFVALTRQTVYEVDVAGCTAKIQVRTDDYTSAAQLYLIGEGLVKTEGVTRGKVTIQLRQLETEPGEMFDPRDIDLATLTPSCETTARVTLIRLPDPPDAGSGAP